MNLVRSGIFSTVAFVAALGAACGGSDATTSAASASSSSSSSSGGAPAPGTSTDGGSGTDAAPAPPPPEVGGEAPEGIFVSASKGIAGADGAKMRPVKTIAEGLPLAEAKGLPLIVCAEAYAEAITMRSGVTMYGYFGCDDLESWKRTAARATVTSPTSPAVLAEGIAAPTRFEGFDVKAPDLGGASATEPAASSYAMVIRNSKDLAITGVTLTAGRGQDGLDGADPLANNEEVSANHDGRGAGMQHACSSPVVDLCFGVKTSSGSAGGTSQCKAGTSGGPGGKGGMGPYISGGAVVDPISASEAHGLPEVGTAETATGGIGVTTQANATAVGSKGSPGSVGSLGKNGTWAFEPTGFVPGAGEGGGIGNPGQGGGGGGGGRGWYNADYTSPSVYPSTNNFGISGAGGGAGGCGGLPGTAGRGGGASVALLVIASQEITIATARIVGGKGGRAGKGAQGLAGLAGGRGGAGRYAGAIDARPYGVYGLGGGDGGKGGAAGMSGHGAPGPSIALAYSGPKPKLDANTTQLVAGSGGDGYAETVTPAQTRPAVVGEAKTEHTF